ncbi:MAG: hypothetical protein ACI9MC_004062 [Kiritimatiellia bacterium]|jgi:hypothetical protein
MTLVAFMIHEVELETLAAPTKFRPTAERSWLVNPLEAPMWVWFASAVPAALVSLLLYLDQNITVRLVNSPEYKLKKGAGFHLDLAVVGVLVDVCSMFGLPWKVAATVRSRNHVRSLATVETEAAAHGVPTDRVCFGCRDPHQCLIGARRGRLLPASAAHPSARAYVGIVRSIPVHGRSLNDRQPAL